MDLAAGDYLSEAPYPLLHTVLIQTPVLIHTGRGGGGGLTSVKGCGAEF
jgi:hypothetical protein